MVLIYTNKNYMEALKENIIKLRKEGKTYNMISKLLNCSKSTVSYHCTKIDENKKLINININNKTLFNLNISKDVIDNVLLLRNSGKTYKEIKEVIFISHDNIKKICRLYNINISSNLLEINNINQQFIGQKVNDKLISEMQKYYDEGYSCNETAKKFNISKSTVIKYIKTRPLTKLDDKTFKEHKVKAVIDWRVRTKIKAVEYKGGKCELCGYNKCISSLTFHHKDPMKKDFTISGKSYSWDRIKNEVDKCILVCNNCHGEIHEELRKNK